MKTFVICKGGKTNSHGFKMNVAGMDMERFKSNPVMLYNHDRENVIGRWENIRVEKECVLADANFDVEDELGKEVARKVEKGFLKACSIGMFIKNMVEDSTGVTATKTELLEVSIVSVPSDADAITLYDANNQPTDFESVRLSYNFTNKNQKMDKNLELTSATLVELSIEGEPTAEAVELAVKAQRQRITELETKLAKIEKEKVTELINNAVAAKKIGNDMKEYFLKLAEKDYDSVLEILAAMPSVQPVKAQLTEKGAASKYDGKNWDDLDKAGMLASLKAEAPEQYDVLYKEKFKNQ